MGTCSKCGATFPANVRFCSQCGVPLFQQTQAHPLLATTPQQSWPPTPISNELVPAEQIEIVAARLEGCSLAFSRLPLALLTAAMAFILHFYLMAFINDGIFPSGVEKPSFVLPDDDNVRDPAQRKQRKALENSIGKVVNPSLPYTHGMLNSKDRASYKASFSMNANQPIKAPPMPQRLWAAFFNGNFNSAFAIWTVLSMLMWSVVMNTFRFGPIRGVFRLFGQPFELVRWVRQCSLRDWGALLGGVGFTLVGSSVLSFGPEATLILGMAGLVFAPSPVGVSVANFIFRMVPALLKSPSSSSQFSHRASHLVVAGMPLGFLLARFLPFAGIGLGVFVSGIGLTLFISGSARKLTSNAIPGGTLTMLLTFLFWFAINEWLKVPLFADDGGQPEFTGSIGEWIASDGGVETAIHSAAGTFGAGLGPLLGPVSAVPLPTESKTPESQASSTQTGTQILSGDAALNWLQRNNYLNPDGTFSQHYWTDFHNRPHSTPTGPGLQGVADNRDAPDGDIAIIISEEQPTKEPLPLPDPMDDPVELTEPKEPPVEPPKEPPVEPPKEPVTPPVKGPTMTELRDRWRNKERELKREMDRKRRRQNELGNKIKHLEHEYDIARHSAVSNGVVECADIFAGLILKKFGTSSVSGAWWKALIKGTLKKSIRNLIRYRETGRWRNLNILQRIIDSYGIKKGAPPSAALKQWMQNVLGSTNDLGVKALGESLGHVENMTSLYSDTKKSMETTARLRTQINSYRQEYRQIGSFLEHAKDDHAGLKSAADEADRCILADA